MSTHELPQHVRPDGHIITGTALSVLTERAKTSAVRVSQTGDVLSLHQQGRREDFTVQGLHITGRGGTFDLRYYPQQDFALSVVDSFAPCKPPFTVAWMQLFDAQGFDIERYDTLRWRRSLNATMFRLTHRATGGVLWLQLTDDTSGVLWLQLTDDEYEPGEPNTQTLYASNYLLAWTHDPYGFQNHVSWALDEGDLQESRCLYGQGVRPADVQALSDMARRGVFVSTRTDIGHAPDMARYELYPLEHTRITRLEMLQGGTRQGSEMPL